jgi:hypothetical protein
MKIKGEKARLKAIERRAKWFEKMVKENPSMKWAKGEIDEYFAEEEHANAYAMFLDMLTNNYPFAGTSLPENIIDIVRGR